MFAQVYRKCVNQECFLDVTYLLQVNTLKKPKQMKKPQPQAVPQNKYLNNPSILPVEILP